MLSSIRRRVPLSTERLEDEAVGALIALLQLLGKIR